MRITEIKVFPVNEEKLKAFVSIVLDDCFMVNDVKVIRGKEGFFISMPSRRKRNGKFKDIAHPLNNETRSAMESEILSEYDRVVSNGGSSDPRATGDRAVPPPERVAREESVPGVESSRAGTIEPGPSTDDKTLEEVGETYLRDSFWGT